MAKKLQLVSWAALAGILVPCVLYFAGVISQNAVTASALASTILWFASTPFWMGRELPPDADQVEI